MVTGRALDGAVGGRNAQTTFGPEVPASRWARRPSETAAAVRTRKAAALYSEDQLHRSVAEFLDIALLPPAVWTTFPAGWGKFGIKTAVRLKRSGLKAGMPDIFVFDRVGPVQATKVVGIELKKPGEQPTAAQQLMFARLRAIGVAIHVCESIDAVVRALSQERIGLRVMKWQDEQPAPKRKRRAEISAKPADTGDADGAAQRTAG